MSLFTCLLIALWAGCGVDLLGYTMWGPIASSVPRVDRDDKGNGTLKRFKKKSFDWYKKVIASNGEDLS